MMDLDNVQDKLRKYPYILNLLTETEIRKILEMPAKGKMHPLRNLFLMATGQTSSSQLLTNVEEALKVTFNADKRVREWATSKFKTAIGDLNCVNAASALGEIRAAGLLCAAGFDLDPIPTTCTPTADFQVMRGESQAIVEVATKQMNQKEAERIQLCQQQNEIERDKRFSKTGVYVNEPIVVYPAGSPKDENETVGENVGHKLASIKPKASQASGDIPSLLWIDLQDEDWWSVSPSHARPSTTWNGDFYSGGLWHGIYGERGMPTFEGQSVEERAVERTFRQTYPGLFSQEVFWSAVILSFRRSTIIFEHPSPRQPLPEPMWQCLLNLPWFSYEDSWISWPSGSSSVKEQVEQAKNELECLAKYVKYLW